MASEQKTIEVNKKMLPISCPPKDTPAWDMHPRVYLEMSHTGESKCPYCGCHFKLVEQ